MIAAIIASVAVLSPGAATHHQLSVRPFVAGSEALTSIAATPSEPHRLYATTKHGRILMFENGKYRGVFLDIENRVRSGDTEQGLLSVAFHPNYRRNHRFYVNYTDFAGNTRSLRPCMRTTTTAATAR